jgi:hypothetical protein
VYPFQDLGLHLATSRDQGFKGELSFEPYAWNDYITGGIHLSHVGIIKCGHHQLILNDNPQLTDHDPSGHDHRHSNVPRQMPQPVTQKKQITEHATTDCGITKHISKHPCQLVNNHAGTSCRNVPKMNHQAVLLQNSQLGVLQWGSASASQQQLAASSVRRW